VDAPDAAAASPVGSALSKSTRRKDVVKKKKKPIPCIYYAKGYCRNGELCRFAHTVTQANSKAQVPKPPFIDDKDRQRAAMIVDGAWAARAFRSSNDRAMTHDDFARIIREAELYLPLNIKRELSSYFNVDADDFFHKILGGLPPGLLIRDGLKSLQEEIPRKSGIRFVQSKFKERHVRCPCGHGFPTFAQKGTDISIALEMMSKAASESVDAILFVAGDMDFAPVIEFVTKQFNKPVYLIGWEKCLSSDLLKPCEGYHFLLSNDLPLPAKAVYQQKAPASPTASQPTASGEKASSPLCQPGEASASSPRLSDGPGGEEGGASDASPEVRAGSVESLPNLIDF